MSFDPQKALRQQREAEISKSWFLTKLHEFNQAHNRVKNTVHTAWRYPLPPWGRAMMGFVYFSIPVIAGYYLGNWAYSKSESTLEERFGKESEGERPKKERRKEKKKRRERRSQKHKSTMDNMVLLL